MTIFECQRGSKMVYRILRLPDVLRERGESRSTAYARISDRLLTRPVKLGARAVGWPATEIASLNAARIAGNSDDEIRSLVESLEKARKRAGVEAGT